MQLHKQHILKFFVFYILTRHKQKVKAILKIRKEFNKNLFLIFLSALLNTIRERLKNQLNQKTVCWKNVSRCVKIIVVGLSG